MGTLLLGLDRVLYIINRCKVYETLYLHDPLRGHALDNFISALIRMYVFILRFLSKAFRLYSNNTGSRALIALWNPDELVRFDDDCREREGHLDMEARNCEACFNRQRTHELENLLTELKTLRDLRD